MPGDDMTRAVFLDGRAYEKMADGSLRPIRSRTDRARLDAMTDAEITAAAEADPDARPMSDDDWAKAAVVTPTKVQVGMRLDSDVIDWFKRGGAGYQTRINAVLRRYIEAQRRTG